MSRANKKRQRRFAAAYVDCVRNVGAADQIDERITRTVDKALSGEQWATIACAMLGVSTCTRKCSQ
jgi:hypothetical protein